MQYFSKKSLFKVFEENGFKIEAYYANLTGAPYTDDAMEIGVVARKNSTGSSWPYNPQTTVSKMAPNIFPEKIFVE